MSLWSNSSKFKTHFCYFANTAVLHSPGFIKLLSAPPMLHLFLNFGIGQEFQGGKVKSGTDSNGNFRDQWVTSQWLCSLFKTRKSWVLICLEKVGRRHHRYQMIHQWKLCTKKKKNNNLKRFSTQSAITTHILYREETCRGLIMNTSWISVAAFLTQISAFDIDFPCRMNPKDFFLQY